MALSDMESASLTVKNILSPKHLTLVIDFPFPVTSYTIFLSPDVRDTSIRAAMMR